jgi:hypothetical protein
MTNLNQLPNSMELMNLEHNFQFSDPKVNFIKVNLVIRHLKDSSTAPVVVDVCLARWSTPPPPHLSCVTCDEQRVRVRVRIEITAPFLLR